MQSYGFCVLQKWASSLIMKSFSSSTKSNSNLTLFDGDREAIREHFALCREIFSNFLPKFVQRTSDDA